MASMVRPFRPMPPIVATGGIEEGADGFDGPPVAADDAAEIFGIYADAKKDAPVVAGFLDIDLIGVRNETVQNHFEEISHGIPGFTEG